MTVPSRAEAPSAPRPEWIAVDWGTSHLRAWAMGAGGAVLATAESDAGMARLEPGGFEAALLSAVGGWLGEAAAPPVIACGMVGARQGWVEAGYRVVPCAPLGPPFCPAPVRDGRLRVHVVPGLSQAQPPDVMRGEETQIAGFLAARPGFDGVLCLPGTHTKWAHVSAGEVVSFQTAMTGELFDLLSRQSVLRHALGGGSGGGGGWQDAAFAEAVADALARPERLAAELFRIRAASLLHPPAPAAARARLSGLLIGAELAAARPWWLGREVAVIGEGGLAALYSGALAAQGVPAPQHEAGPLTRAGLGQARALLEGGA